MRFKPMTPVVLCLSLLTTVGSAQTVAERLQRAIYAQETTGDVDSAIQIYRQILTSTPSRPFAAQVQYRLAQALLQKGDLQNAALEFQILSQSYPEYKDLIASMASQGRPAPHHDLGTVQAGRYRNSLTNVELTVPEGWLFKGDGESSGDGQMARIDSGSGITVWIWMKPVTMRAADIPLGLRKAMEDKPSMRPDGWKIRPESVQERSLSGHLGLSAIADYMQNGKPMVEYDFWVQSGKTHVFFFGEAEEQKLEALQASIETVAKLALIP
jgi:hypothetical protein